MAGAPINPRLEFLTEDELPLRFGPYELLAQVGRGGMGQVFAARRVGEHGFRRPCAVKFVLASQLHQQRDLGERLLHEAKIGALLTHSNVVQTSDTGVIEGLPFIEMELLQGVPLAVLLGAGVDLSGFAPRIGAQIAQALQYVHDFEHHEGSEPLVHRDVKPSNIFVTRSGDAKLLDFGIAKARGFGKDTSHGVKGTPGYLSPEQAAGQAIDGRSDLFALGLVLFELACGRRFLPGDTAEASIASLLQVELLLQREDVAFTVDQRVPGLGPIVYRCLREAPSARFPNADALADALEALPQQGRVAALREHVRDHEADRVADTMRTPWLDDSGDVGGGGGPRKKTGRLPSVPESGPSRRRWWGAAAAVAAVALLVLVSRSTTDDPTPIVDSAPPVKRAPSPPVERPVERAPAPPVVAQRAASVRVGRCTSCDWVFSAPASLRFTKSEVTLAQYEGCVSAGECKRDTFETKSDNKYCNWGYGDRGAHPMNCVSWFGADQFCRWAGGHLPNEHEWYAEASNGDTRVYPWGGDTEASCRFAVMDDGQMHGNPGTETDGCGEDHTGTVCSPSRAAGSSVSGLCDMSGNVWEWTQSEDGGRVVRGGSWLNASQDYLRASARYDYDPSHRSRDIVGFRCVRPPAQ